MCRSVTLLEANGCMTANLPLDAFCPAQDSPWCWPPHITTTSTVTSSTEARSSLAARTDLIVFGKRLSAPLVGTKKAIRVMPSPVQYSRSRRRHSVPTPQVPIPWTPLQEVSSTVRRGNRLALAPTQLWFQKAPVRQRELGASPFAKSAVGLYSFAIRARTPTQVRVSRWQRDCCGTTTSHNSHREIHNREMLLLRLSSVAERLLTRMMLGRNCL